MKDLCTFHQLNPIFKAVVIQLHAEESVCSVIKGRRGVVATKKGKKKEDEDLYKEGKEINKIFYWFPQSLLNQIGNSTYDKQNHM